eukprot:CAMPEP_0172748222 /NCGR_PEP_ID=MMETSP1074-20121228/144597_1 /TAXON_ID=2916 /ORGANISM="Ceratium fusus, Strain PA161109" /LENGTH=75 /DNA_ID=CAMNT_0013579931 /DNA_START=101 /DNA_END=328 /DNA_ORIENTATION=-
MPSGDNDRIKVLFPQGMLAILPLDPPRCITTRLFFLLTLQWLCTDDAATKARVPSQSKVVRITNDVAPKILGAQE